MERFGLRRFNGAALFRARRVDSATMTGLGSFASTGPRSFERGEQARAVDADAVAELQRGRALSSAESVACDAQDEQHGRASTGPRSFERGETLAYRADDGRKRRFNGAALFRARRDHRHRRRCHRRCRFNGAALFRARRGPAPPVPPSLRKSCFNGAALFRARRGMIDTDLLVPFARFNGAALFRARRDFGVLPNSSIASFASTGPRSFERGEQQ